jgi:hypothetical protein
MSSPFRTANGKSVEPHSNQQKSNNTNDANGTSATNVPVRKQVDLPNVVKSTSRFYISPLNRRLLSAAHAIAMRDGIAVVYVTGESGYGKTRLGHVFASQIGFNCVEVQATSIMEGEEWFGVRHVEKDETTFRKTEFANALSAGNTVIIIDELSRVAPFVQNPLLSLMHDDGQFTVHNETFYAEHGTIFFVTANIGDKFTGTYELDVALESRLTVQLKMTDIPQKTFVNIVASQSGSERWQAEVAVGIVTWLKKSGFEVRDTSPRFAIKIARLMSVGLQLVDVKRLVADMIEIDTEKKQFIDYFEVTYK